MPLLSLTVPVIVARPRTPLPLAEAVIDSIIARATSGVLNLKIVFIAARPPGQPRADLARLWLERKPDRQFTLVRFSNCFVQMPERLLGIIVPNPIPPGRRETTTRLN